LVATGRAHLDRVDLCARYALARRDAEQVPDAGHRGIAIARGIFGQQLVRDERAVGLARDDIGERAAAVDPELPAGL
jgi:hypothetical protein